MTTPNNKQAAERTRSRAIRSRVRKLLRHFKTTGFKNGDLVITAEIHRVVDARWGQKNYSPGMEVVTVFPSCSACGPNRVCQHSRIMGSGRGGQQMMMALKAEGRAS